MRFSTMYNVVLDVSNTHIRGSSQQIRHGVVALSFIWAVIVAARPDGCAELA